MPFVGPRQLLRLLTAPSTLLRLDCLQDQIDALGPWGGVLFVITVMCAEMIPLFPTQPLTLASGLLFGPFKVTHVLTSRCSHIDRRVQGAMAACGESAAAWDVSCIFGVTKLQ